MILCKSFLAKTENHLSFNLLAMVQRNNINGQTFVQNVNHYFVKKTAMKKQQKHYRALEIIFFNKSK